MSYAELEVHKETIASLRDQLALADRLANSSRAATMDEGLAVMKQGVCVWSALTAYHAGYTESYWTRGDFRPHRMPVACITLCVQGNNPAP